VGYWLFVHYRKADFRGAGPGNASRRSNKALLRNLRKLDRRQSTDRYAVGHQGMRRESNCFFIESLQRRHPE